MCTCFVYIGMFIMGIVALVKGEIGLTRKTKVYGGWARAIGILFICTGPIIIGTMFMIGVVAGLQIGDPDEVQQWVEDSRGMFIAIEYSMLGASIIAAFVMAKMGASSVPPQSTQSTLPGNQFQPPADRPPSDNPYEPPIT